MLSVGTYEAKTRLSQLIAKVKDTGEQSPSPAMALSSRSFRRRRPSRRRPPALKRRLEHWLETRKNVRLNGLRVRDLINAGRR